MLPQLVADVASITDGVTESARCRRLLNDILEAGVIKRCLCKEDLFENSALHLARRKG